MRNKSIIYYSLHYADRDSPFSRDFIYDNVEIAKIHYGFFYNAE